VFIACVTRRLSTWFSVQSVNQVYSIVLKVVKPGADAAACDSGVSTGGQDQSLHATTELCQKTIFQ